MSESIEEFAKHLIKNLAKRGASDIHILPTRNRYRIYFRTSNELIEWQKVTIELGSRLIAYFKFLANMEVSEKRKPQSGAAELEIGELQKSLRFSTITNFNYQESMVIRLLLSKQDCKLEETTFFPKAIGELQQLVSAKSGLILFSGPVSSGKTTTMYHLVKEQVDKKQSQVITIEDPVEIEQPEFLQTQLNEEAGITYEVILKASLRHHPDILIVGEIRDSQTAKNVLRGALTGHLILASIHAKDTEGVLLRMLELGVSLLQLQQVLLAVVSQRLIAKKCSLCKGNCHFFCTHFPHDHKKATLYEILSYQLLEKRLQELQEEIFNRKQTNGFNEVLRKAYAYGYITKESYQQFQIR
ncbi:competence type IV pilus ATPase ComGA [Carnobacterium divergens]|uniref:General secretion pathway protein E n=1 Tax=Carnobacterium divergens DSM 20623 TaxID=1449336 RepID=A0A0R2HPD2_CARDV|nr:competence type IV pilus ATPase ComGA [Carnobacterium divergens]KRN54739.1 general secretion pathway protein E [Carnobacterium divergens DSM 20623]MDO0874226.1 Flp pilus assembly complex ATPase component TadA [Carnobacterium divergens]SUX21054.1 Type II traffic warden ATPase [Carnobacterium divergens]